MRISSGCLVRYKYRFPLPQSGLSLQYCSRSMNTAVDRAPACAFLVDAWLGINIAFHFLKVG